MSKEKDRGKGRHFRLPNGFGSIKNLGGGRSNPYAAITTTKKGAPTGKPHAVGYFRTWIAAFTALCDYNAAAREGRGEALTFAEVYEASMRSKFEKSSRKYAANSRNDYTSAYKNVAALHDIKFRDLRRADMQQALDQCPLGYSSLKNIKKLYNQMYQYALENDIVEKNYSKFVIIGKEDDTESGEPFSPEEIDLLWSHQDHPVARKILVMVYTGFRITAYEGIELDAEKDVYRGGIKTRNGRDRVVPLHPAIRPFAEDFKPGEFKGKTFRIKEFYPFLEKLGILYTAEGKKHTPHDTRHSFSWLCDKYAVDSLSKHLLMGHSLGRDVEQAVYGHRTLEELRAEIWKIAAPGWQGA